MGIFDIFKKKEEYNGVALNDNVDPELQKRLIDLGRSNEISGLDYKTIQKQNQPQPIIKQLVSDQPTVIPDSGQPASSGVNFIDKAKDIAVGTAKFVATRFKENEQYQKQYFTLLAEKKYDEASAFAKKQDKEAKQAILDATFNTPTGKKITGFVAENTSDLPIKLAAAMDPILPIDSGVRDQPYEVRLQAYRDAFRNSQFSDNAAVRIADIAMNSGVQSAIGVLLNFVPYAGTTLSTGYWSAISAQEQVENKGDVYSMGNIVIDTIGDKILGNMIGKMFKSKQAVSKFASAFKGFFVEGGTEVAQTLLKNGNDYFNASSDKEKKDILEKTAHYIKSGDILIELTGAGISGAGITSMAGLVGASPDAEDINLVNTRGNAPVPEIFKEAVDQAKAEAGQEPSIYKQAVLEAKTTAIPATEQAPESIYHMTNANAESIKDGGFIMGLNSVFGEAAFFAGQPNKLYGENQIEVKASDFNLKQIDTLQEQKDFIAEYQAKNLAEAIRKEGEYDGFIIPQPGGNNVFGITDNEKLNQVLKAQQFITTDEALAMRSNFKFLEDLDIPLVAKNKLMTPKGEEAYGKYSAGMISFLENPHKTTIPHETTHAFLDLMVAPKQKQEILNEVKRRYAGQIKQMMEKRGLKEDAAAEEVLADDFTKYYLEKKTKGSSQKSSSKLRQFYDWFIEQLQKMFGTGDKIKQLYKDIETKSPSISDRKRAIKKLTMTLENIEKLQRQYFQEPEKLTTKFLEHPDLKNREFVAYTFLKNLINSKALPLKDIERTLISDVLETQFKDQKKIVLEDFKNAVIGELMPLSIIESETYADYGAGNVQLDDLAAKTYIFNSGFEHGYTGHFSGDFSNNIKKSDLEIKQIPNTESWAVIKKGFDFSGNNATEGILHIARSEDQAKEWIDNKTISKDGAGEGEKYLPTDFVEAGKKGLFSHVRTFDFDGAVSYVAEIQSDSFQKENVNSNSELIAERKTLVDSSKRYTAAFKEAKLEFSKLKDNSTIEEKQSLRDKLNNKFLREGGLAAFDIPLASEISKSNKYIDERLSYWGNQIKHNEGYLKELEAKGVSDEEINFFRYKNIWHERTAREIIRQKAIEGFKTLYFPTPRTVALIEGYTSQDGSGGQIPEGTAIGDRFDYGGEDYIVLEEDQQMGEDGARVAPVSDLHGIFDYDQSRQEDIDREKEDLIYELKNFEGENTPENFAAAVDESSILSNLSDEEKEIIKKDYKENGNFGSNKSDDLLDKAVEAAIDDRYTDNGSYADYYNSDLGDNLVFPLGSDQIISLENNEHIETMTFGKPAKDVDEFSIDEFDGSEKTVLNFYDKQVNRYLSKLRKGNWELMTDDNGNQWYETKIMPEDKAAVEAFQTKDNLDRPKIYTGKQVADYVESVEYEKDEEAEKDDYLLGIIKNQDFTLRPVKIMNLIQADKDLAEYIRNNDQRYPGGADGIDNPIVVGNWKDGSFGVLDGYNRILTKFNEGQQFIDAYVSNDVFELVDDDREMMENFIDYVRLNKTENVELEVAARRFAEGTDLNANISNARLANRFEELLAAVPKFQAMEPSKRADLEYRRNEINAVRDEKDFEQADKILQAREASLAYPDQEKEDGYQKFKKLASRRKWVLDPDTDDMKLKTRLPIMNFDDDLFSGATDMTNNELLERFKDRYYQEQEMTITATQSTPQEISNLKKLGAEKAVRKETTGRNLQLKAAINIAMGKEKPITITKKASVLLKNRLRDMARAAKTGANFGRQEMRKTLTEAFSTKISNLKTMKKAVSTYADALPIGERGKMLKMIANLNTNLDLVKAYARIDAALEAVDNKNQLEQIRYTAIKLKKAMKSGSGIAVDYQKKMAEILNEYDLTKPTQKTIDGLKGLSDFLKNNPDIKLQDHLLKQLDRLNKKSLADFKTDDISELNELLGRLWALGELKYRLQKQGNERAIAAAVDRLLTTTVGTTKTLASLSFLHSPRVADVFDGYREYKGENVKLQRKLSDAVSGSSITTKNIIEDVAEITASIKNKFSKEEQAIMAFNLMKDQGQFDQAQAIINAYSEEFNWQSENDLIPSPEIENVMDILRGVFNKNIDYLAAVYEEIENKPFVKVKNYFPIKYDREFDKTIDIEAPTVNQMAQFMTKQVQKGFTISRVKGVKKVPRIDVFNTFAEAISEQQYYMRVQPAINEISTIVSDRRYQAVLGEDGARWWDKYLKSVASKGRSFNNGIFDSILRKFKLNISNAMLGFKITSALIQPTAIIDAYAYVYLNHGVLAANRLLIKLAATLTIPGYTKSIVKRSVGLQLRTAGELTLREMEEAPYGTRVGKAWRKAGMWALRKMDLITASAVHQAMYKTFKAKGMTEGDARREADFVMNLTQSSSEISDLPLVLQTGELAKTLLTFQTFVLNRWGIIAHDIGGSALINGDIPKKFKGLIALLIISMAGGLENLLRKHINQKITGKEYPDKFTFMQQALLTAPESIPVIGGILTSVIEFNSGMSIPLARVVEDFIRGSKSLISPAGETKSAKEDSRKKGALKAAEALLAIKGVSGASQLSDIIERILIPPDDKPNVIGSSAAGRSRPSLPTPPVRPSLPSRPSPR